MLLNILILEVPSCIYIEYYYYRWDSSCLRSHRSLKVERSYNDDVEHIFDSFNHVARNLFFFACTRVHRSVRTTNNANKPNCANSANNEQCEQRTICITRTVRTVHTVRTVPTANSSFFRNRRRVRTGANIVRWILACTAR